MTQAPFQIRGVIEGFYGAFYTFPERIDLIRFIGRHGFNLYIYGPKNDRQHRRRWWEPYPDEVMSRFAETVMIAQEAGVTFCYAISPIAYTPRKGFEKLTAKLAALYDSGVRSFSIFVDDITCTTHKQPNCKYCEWPADPHIDLCNSVYEWLQALDSACTLSMCPVEYHGRAPFSRYLHELGAGLHPAIDIFYTGPEVRSATITAADAEAVAQAIRRPPLIWDNYPVNDLALRSNLHLGPIRGRDSRLHESVRGIIVNPMLQAEASKIPLLTFADYFRDPDAYDPWRSWERALLEVGGASSFTALSRFAENALRSCLPAPGPSKLEQLTGAALAALRHGEQASTSGAVRALEAYLTALDEAGYHLKNRMHNLRLRDNLLPWIEALEDWVWAGRRAIRVLKRLDSGGGLEHALGELERALDEVARHTKEIGGEALLPLARFALEQAEQRQRSDRSDQRAQIALARRDQHSFG